MIKNFIEKVNHICSQNTDTKFVKPFLSKQRKTGYGTKEVENHWDRLIPCKGDVFLFRKR